MKSSRKLRQANALAVIMRRQPEKERIHFAYRRLFQREPTKKELSIGQTYLGDADQSPAKWTQYAHALLGSNEFLFVD